MLFSVAHEIDMKQGQVLLKKLDLVSLIMQF